ncbi:MAG: hypothetical protein JST89_04005 [Cyanobacteria bacterium SZAS-4]|nr:hypothetical protein [Cyanobacteria bacterium SZAS-4]
MKLKLISLFFVALSLSTELRVCCFESPSSALRAKVKASIEHSDDDSVETVRDYLYLLDEEKASPKAKMQAILDLASFYKSVNDVLPMTVPIWADLTVSDASDMLMLEQILSRVSTVGGVQEELPLARLAEEVDKIEVTDNERLKIKISIISRILFLLQGNYAYSKKIADITLRQIAQATIEPPNNIDTVSFHIIALYYLESPRSTRNGALLASSLRNLLRISDRTGNSNTLPLAENLFPELARRCDVATTIELQKALVETAVKIKLNDSLLGTLQWQLGYAYMLAGDYAKAESALRQSAPNIQSMKLMWKLQLAECLRRQRKTEEYDKLAEEIEKEVPESREKYAFDFAAGAQAIRALNLVDRGNFEAALPLLKSSSEIYSKTTGSRDLAYFNLPLYTITFPDEIAVLTAEAAVNRKLGRVAEAERLEKSVEAIQSSNEQDALTAQTASLLNIAQRDGGIGVQPEDAKSFVALCSKMKLPETRVATLLDYAEVLISNNDLLSAKLCLDAIVDNQMSDAIKSKVIRDLLLIAECQGDLKSTEQLLSKLESTSTNSSDDDRLKNLESLVHRNLLLGDYEKAEMQSRQIEEKLLSLDDKELDKTEQTVQGKFVIDYQMGLLDRARALVQLKSFAPAMILLRALLVRNLDQQTLIDASTLLARCYKESGHPGLAKTCEQNAVILFDNMYRPGTTSYMLADAKFQLAILAAENGNLVRSRRYRAEALKVAAKAHVENTALYKQIVDYR